MSTSGFKFSTIIFPGSLASWLGFSYQSHPFSIEELGLNFSILSLQKWIVFLLQLELVL